jgi:hypothetical protein
MTNRRYSMNLKSVITLVLLALLVGFFGCTKEKATETPVQVQVTKSLSPEKAEVKTANFVVNLTDLQVSMTMDKASQEVVETPRISGRYRITNTSKDLMVFQGIALGYQDQSGKPVSFSSGDKMAKVSLSVNSLSPGESAEGSLDATIPKAAIKNLGKIDINLVYVPSPLRQETVTLPEKIG